MARDCQTRGNMDESTQAAPTAVSGEGISAPALLASGVNLALGVALLAVAALLGDGMMAILATFPAAVAGMVAATQMRVRVGR